MVMLMLSLWTISSDPQKPKISAISLELLPFSALILSHSADCQPKSFCPPKEVKPADQLVRLDYENK